MARLTTEMGSRPGLAEYIATYEAANNAPHGLILLIAGAAYALQALGDMLDERLAGRPRGGPRRRKGGRLRRWRDRNAGES